MKHKIAVWAITPKGAILACKIAQKMSVDLRFSEKLSENNASCFLFQNLSKDVADVFNEYDGHIFIMSTGIVIRVIAPHIKNKTIDPAVVAMDETGQYVISLLSGHIGGANNLAKKIAHLIKAKPVITTATDVNMKPAIDVIAKEKGLFIENPEALKTINMALLLDEKIYAYDPAGILADNLFTNVCLDEMQLRGDIAGIFIDDATIKLSPQTLILRHCSLVAGIGCNKNTSFDEIKLCLFTALKKYGLSPNSLKLIASINLKQNESGLIALTKHLKLPIKFFDKQELKRVNGIKTPSVVVEKYTGVKSVCEAAAILGAGNGKLIVPKQLTKNATVAVARIPFTS